MISYKTNKGRSIDKMLHYSYLWLVDCGLSRPCIKVASLQEGAGYSLKSWLIDVG